MAIRKPTLYQLLMVDPSVDDDVLTVVYRRLVQRTNLAYEDDARRRERLSVIEQAYAVLHDAGRRRRYDLRVAGIPERDAQPLTGETVAVLPVEPPRQAIPIEAPRRVIPVKPASTSVPIAALGGGARVLDFGRYAGWSLRQVALRDPDYLEWLRRTPGGRHFQADISLVLAPR
jgi:curved DNA-binding protein CbpA